MNNLVTFPTCVNIFGFDVNITLNPQHVHTIDGNDSKT